MISSARQAASGRHGETERLGGLEIDHQFELSSRRGFCKILRGYRASHDQRRDPLLCDHAFLRMLVEPPFESFDFAFEPNRLDLLHFALNLETIYDVALSAEFGKLVPCSAL